MAIEDLRKNAMMSHLLDALDRGEDIGHYGRLTFTMIARHFVPEEELCAWLQKNPGVSESDARVLCKQVEGRDYNPPRRERIREWQEQQSFPICPDPNACNVYRDLKFPEHVYEHIREFYEGQVDSRRG
ncbi:MAG TPA: hypothetical protein VJ276_18995, partial [Thermoanaerobaculia bacterium]|nr:hypothetical protein [Thermoanaerobaculia bacterium]